MDVSMTVTALRSVTLEIVRSGPDTWLGISTDGGCRKIELFPPHNPARSAGGGPMFDVSDIAVHIDPALLPEKKEEAK